MDKKTKRFLLTNDDGIYARGLTTLYREMSLVGECTIVAPEREQSAVGHAITLARPLMVKKARKGGTFWGYAVEGTPADCVKIGVGELSEVPFDCIVSGINRGANVGINVIYSGTVSAATEGTILGIPSIAVSLDSHERDADYSVAARIAAHLADAVVTGGLVGGFTLNINIPALPASEIKGLLLTRQGTARFEETFEKRVDPRENIYYWLAGETRVPDGDDTSTDAAAVRAGYISITPLHYDLTRYHDMEMLKQFCDAIDF